VWGKGEVHIGFWWGDLREGDHVEDASIDLRIIIKWLFKVLEGGMVWIDLARDREVAGSYKFDSEPSGCIKYGEFRDFLRTP
jgi:hypothetical protein